MVPTLWPKSHPNFPPELHSIPTPPDALYTLGNPDTLNAPRVAIVGTRRPSLYGERVTRKLASTLAEAGACIVSGMALGIDSFAHEAALKANGRTVAVLGTGIDYIYPPSNATLYHEILNKGLIISEFGPGTKTFRGCFPRRNRIIAGLAQVTIVVEAGPKSGASITARYALDANRTVAAVPGPIDAPTSYTPNHLIRDGAQVIATIDDALALLSLTPSKGGRNAQNNADSLTTDESLLLKTLSSQNLTTDHLIAQTKLPIDRCLAALTTLELRGLIQTQLTGEITRL
jgi:DNA processing protein